MKNYRRKDLCRLRCAGFTLIEMLIAGAVLLVLINVCMGLFLSASRVAAYTTAAFDRAEILSELEQDFAELVRESVTIAEGYAEYRTSEEQLVLRMPANGYRIIGTLNNPERLAWLEYRDGELVDMGGWPLPLAEVRFSYPQGAGLVQLDVRVKRESERAAQSEVVRRILAAPRGMGTEGR